ncbi:hypothetical protein LTR17_003577 [Elasticomyces elasticus]|nr:hypothetical protein LTR17_003577 [Elasticomyces elasticus]
MLSEEARIQGFVFEATARAFAGFDALTQAQGDDNTQNLHIAVLDNSSRFNIWVGDIGARYPAADQRSADHRLRDAPRPASRILDILRDLCENNHELLNILLGHRQDAADVDAEDAEDGRDDDEAFDLEVFKKPVSEAHELCLGVTNLITSLMKVSILVRDTKPRDKYAEAAAKRAMPEWTASDRNHVGEKFPKVKNQLWLLERLGDAITARRHFLGYSQEHHQKRLASKTNRGYDVSGASTNNAASTLDSGIMQSLSLYQVDENDDTTLQANTDIPHAAAVDRPLKFSSLEMVAKGDLSFECPHCWGIVTCRTQRDWEVHVLEDLRAYVCTFEGCTTGPFETRDSWFSHELELHRRQWHCPLCTGIDKMFHSAKQLENHLLSRHADRLPQAIVRSIAEANSSPSTEYAMQDACALCDDWSPSTLDHAPDDDRDQTILISVKKVEEHIATHLEQLALFALPRPTDNASDLVGDGDDVQDIVPSTSQLAIGFASTSPSLQGSAPTWPVISFALYPFEPENSNELRLREGQVIMVSARHERGWLVAEDGDTGKRGLVPEGYVRLSA